MGSEGSRRTYTGKTQAAAGLAYLEDTAGTTPLTCPDSPVGTASAIRERFTTTGEMDTQLPSGKRATGEA